MPRAYSLQPTVYSLLLWPAARLWSVAARARAHLYASGKCRQQRLARPVVSVGNLSAGGTGKTPFVIWLFGALSACGLKPAVLTRGYRRRDGSDTLLLLSREEAPEDGADEVRIMLRHGVAPIGVDASRFRAGRALEDRCDADLFLLDDGFQHLALARDLDIVLLDSSRLPWDDDLLPAGRLREPPSALRRAGAIVVTRVQKWTELEAIKRQLKRWNQDADVYFARARLVDPVPEGTLLAFAGIGNPKAFFADLCMAGGRVIATRSFRDHHRYTVADLRRLERQARDAGAETLVTTEKDDVNLPAELRARLYLPLRIVRMDLEVEGGDQLVERIKQLIHHG